MLEKVQPIAGIVFPDILDVAVKERFKLPCTDVEQNEGDNADNPLRIQTGRMEGCESNKPASFPHFL